MSYVETKDDEVLGKLYSYTHFDIPLQGLNGNPFHNFTDGHDFDFERMDDEICAALAVSDLSKLPMVGSAIPPKFAGDLPLEEDALFNFDGDLEIVKNMTQQERRKYMIFKRKCIAPWFFVLDLKPNVFKTKHLDKFPWEPIMEMMPYTKSCIEKLPFKEIGRVVIYGSWADSKVVCHRDYPPRDTISHHINFHPGGNRPVYVYDSMNDKKIYLPDDYRLYAYNVTDYHGVDPVPYFSYTVRVDGTYDDSVGIE